MTRMSAPNPSPASRRRWILPLVVIVLWLFVGGPMGSFAGKLAEVQENDNAAYLPQSTESTEALNTLLEFQAEETFPTTIVFERAGGLTEADQAAIAAYAGDLAKVKDVIEGGVSAPIPSEDGEAAQLVVQTAGTDGEEVTEAVDAMREVVADPPDGLTALVGGQGGILGDFIVAFGAIDGVLLLVALAVVFLILVVVYRTPILPIVVLLSAVLSLGVASAVIYALAKADVLTIAGRVRASCSSWPSAPRPTTPCSSSPASERSCVTGSRSTTPCARRTAAPSSRSWRPA